MARVQNTLIGRSSGSVSQTTFLTWKTINVVRSKMSHQTNPKTQLQRNQRMRYNLLREFYKNFQNGIDIGFASRTRKRSAFNAFMARNLKPENFIGDAPTMSIDYSKLVLAYGQAPFTCRFEANILNHDFVGYGFYLSPFPLNFPEVSKVLVFIYNETQNFYFIYNEYWYYGDEEFIYYLPVQSNLGDTVHEWITVSSETVGLYDTRYRNAIVTT